MHKYTIINQFQQKNHKSSIQEYELVLVGPNIFHGWNNGKCKNDQIHEITVQFHRDLIHESLLDRNMMKPIKELLTNASKGILFSDNMTETTLSRLMKQRTGKSFVDFVNDYRIGFAARWLTETKQTIAEIAFRCGFYNISNFNRIFRKIKGCTPGEYRVNFSGIKRVS